MMSHWIQNSRKVDVKSHKSTTSLKQRLLAARDEAELSFLVRGAILDKLVALLQLNLEVAGFDDTLRMDELGVDSLMATEIRLLLMSSFKVNVPVLRIMSGISLKELVTTVVELFDPSKIPNNEAQ